MTDLSLDPRLNAIRPDLADASLKGQVEAERFVHGEMFHVTSPVAAVRREPRADAPLDTQVLGGEQVSLFDDRDGWAWVQLQQDGYVGYVPSSALARGPILASHKITVPRTFAFGEPDIKTTPVAEYYVGSTLQVDRVEGGFAVLSNGTYVHAAHVGTEHDRVSDPVELAAQFVGVPYLWGGKTHHGIDCSGLVQVALTAADIPCPRDSDMQQDKVGHPPADPTDLRRGDLVFWPGHVGIMLDATRLLHANAYHMRVASELLEETVRRLTEQGIEISAVRRPTAAIDQTVAA